MLLQAIQAVSSETDTKRINTVHYRCSFLMSAIASITVHLLAQNASSLVQRNWWNIINKNEGRQRYKQSMKSYVKSNKKNLLQLEYTLNSLRRLSCHTARKQSPLLNEISWLSWQWPGQWQQIAGSWLTSHVVLSRFFGKSQEIKKRLYQNGESRTVEIPNIEKYSILCGQSL